MNNELKAAAIIIFCGTLGAFVGTLISVFIKEFL